MIDIVLDNLCSGEIVGFLNEHLNDMRSVSPPESTHALDLEGLKSKDVTFWSVYDDGKLVACGAIKELDQFHGEIKSMRTAESCRGKGIASLLLKHILQHAASRGFTKVSLETGSLAYFKPARKLYARHGFELCGSFADYKTDPNSVFMSRSI